MVTPKVTQKITKRITQKSYPQKVTPKFVCFLRQQRTLILASGKLLQNLPQKVTHPQKKKKVAPKNLTLKLFVAFGNKDCYRHLLPQKRKKVTQKVATPKKL